MKILIDTCVVIDVLQKREPFYKDAMEVFLAVSTNRCMGILPANAITDIHYIVRRSIHHETEVRKLIHTLVTLFEVANTLPADCQIALQSEMEDYEAAIMVETAKRVEADYIITRNLKDYQNCGVQVYSPDEFVKLLKTN